MFLLLRSSPLSHFGRLLECQGLTENPKHVLVISAWAGGVRGGGGSGRSADLQEEESGFSCFSSA